MRENNQQNKVDYENVMNEILSQLYFPVIGYAFSGDLGKQVAEGAFQFRREAESLSKACKFVCYSTASTASKFARGNPFRW